MRYRISGRTILNILSISILLLLTSACAFWDFAEPGINDIFPAQDQSFSTTNEVTTLYVVFNAKMNHFTVENSVSLKKINRAHFDEETVAGEFTWVDSGLLQETLEFHPRQSLVFGKYRLDITVDCEDLQGNNLDHQTNIYFQIGTDSTAPQLLSVTPADGSLNIAVDQNIVLTFDEPIDTGKLPELFSLDPGESWYVHASSNNTRFELILLEAMSAGLHTLTVSGISDVYGNAWYDEQSFYFTVGSDFVNPVFIGLYTNTNAPAFITNTINTMDKKQDLFFVFSEQMDVDLLNVPVTFSPSLDGEWYQYSNILHFVPLEDWEIARPYTIDIAANIPDMAGNETKVAGHYQAQISSAVSYFIELASGVCLSTNLITAGINTIALTNGATNDFYMDFFLQFNTPLEDYSTLENISVSYISGSGTLVSPYISTFAFSSTIHLKDTVMVRIKDMSYFNLYKLTVSGTSGGIRDTNNNWLQEDIEIYFRPEHL